MTTNVTVPLNSGTSEYFFYIDQTAAQLSSLSLRGTFSNTSSGESANFTPSISSALDYATGQTFTVTLDDGSTQSITLYGFRKPTAVENTSTTDDYISLDFTVTSDTATNTVFALLPDNSNPSSADILNANNKLIRNLDSSTDEGLVFYRATDTKTDMINAAENLLTPNTPYDLWFAHTFANGTFFMKLADASTDSPGTNVNYTRRSTQHHAGETITVGHMFTGALVTGAVRTWAISLPTGFTVVVSGGNSTDNTLYKEITGTTTIGGVTYNVVVFTFKSEESYFGPVQFGNDFDNVQNNYTAD